MPFSKTETSAAVEIDLERLAAAEAMGSDDDPAYEPMAWFRWHWKGVSMPYLQFKYVGFNFTFALQP